MKKFLLKILKYIIPIIIVYLFISCIYIVSHISFFESDLEGVFGQEEPPASVNFIRILMGLPAVGTTRRAVDYTYFFQVFIKCIIAFDLWAVYPLINKKAQTSWYKFIIIFFEVVIIILSLVKYTEKIELDSKNVSNISHNISVATYNFTSTYDI